MSQLEAGVLALEREMVDLADIVKDLGPHLTPLVAKHRLEMDFPGSLPPVFADTHRVLQVISNLVSNAAKFSDPGTRITIAARRSDDRLIVSVADEGRGIAQDHLDQIFEPFYRVEGSSTATSSGSGLGLSICRRLVEAHGGEMWVESDLGKGSTLSFSFPAAK